MLHGTLLGIECPPVRAPGRGRRVDFALRQRPAVWHDRCLLSMDDDHLIMCRAVTPVLCVQRHLAAAHELGIGKAFLGKHCRNRSHDTTPLLCAISHPRWSLCAITPPSLSAARIPYTARAPPPSAIEKHRNSGMILALCLPRKDHGRIRKDIMDFPIK